MPVDFSGWGDGPLPRGVGLRVADTNGSAEELANHLIVTNPGVAVRDWCWAGEWLTAGLGAADEDQLTWLNEYHAALAEFVEPRGYRHLVDLLGAPE
jgi:hypothetical protein